MHSELSDRQGGEVILAIKHCIVNSLNEPNKLIYKPLKEYFLYVADINRYSVCDYLIQI